MTVYFTSFLFNNLCPYPDTNTKHGSKTNLVKNSNKDNIINLRDIELLDALFTTLNLF